MKPQYKDHLTEWRPDYPTVWNGIIHYTDYGMQVVDINKPRRKLLQNRNINAFTTSVKAIIKAMKQ